LNRAQRWLGVLLIAQVALLLLIHNPFTKKAGATEQTLLPALASITPERLEVAGPGGAATGFVRKDAVWTLADPEGYPVLPGKIEKLLQDLGNLKTGRQVVSSSRYHASLKVATDDFERRIRIWEKAGGSPKIELYVGTSPSYGVTHVRVNGNDRVFEASGLNSYDIPVESSAWIERNLTMVPATEVTALAVANRKGKFSLVKKDGSWGFADPAARGKVPLDQDKVTQLVSAMCGMSIEKPLAAPDEKTQGLSAPEATVTFTRVPAHPDSVAPQPQIVTVKIGGLVPGPDQQRYALRSGSPFGATVAKYGYDRALSATLTELLKTK